MATNDVGLNGFYLLRNSAVFLCSAIIPLPIFFNLATGGFIIETNFIIQGERIPIPIGGVSFFFLMMCFYFSSLYKNKKYINILSVSKLSGFFVFFIVPLFLYMVGLSDLSVPRAAQLLLPIVGMAIITIPMDWGVRKNMARGVLTGLLLFLVVHIFYLSRTYDDLFQIDHIEFSYWLGFLIYQALVTYPAVLTLYMAICYYLICSPATKGIEKILAVSVFPACFLVVLLAARRASMFEISSLIFAFFVFAVMPVFYKGRIGKKTIFLGLVSFMLSPVLYFLFYESPLFERASSSASQGTFDSGRLDIYKNAVSFLGNDVVGLLLGYGGGDTVGFHNLFLDTVHRIGLLGIFFLFVGVAYIINKWRKKTFFMRVASVSTEFKVSLFAIAANITLQTLVNTSITQLYYAINFSTVFLILFMSEIMAQQYKLTCKKYLP